MAVDRAIAVVYLKVVGHLTGSRERRTAEPTRYQELSVCASGQLALFASWGDRKHELSSAVASMRNLASGAAAGLIPKQCTAVLAPMKT